MMLLLSEAVVEAVAAAIPMTIGEVEIEVDIAATIAVEGTINEEAEANIAPITETTGAIPGVPGSVYYSFERLVV